MALFLLLQFYLNRWLPVPNVAVLMCKFISLVNCYCESKIGKWLLLDVLLPF